MLLRKGLLVFGLCLQLISVAYGQLAAMSIDLGDEFLKFGLVKPGVPMETVINKESRRKTPNIVAIRKGERFFGDTAAQMSVKFPANAITSYMDLLGKQMDHPLVEQYQQRFPYHKLSAHPDRGTVVFSIEDTSYPVETILAMTLWNAQEQTSAHAGQQVKNVVISIPSYYNHSERVAVWNATQIANLNLLSLMYDGCAAALNYGVFRSKEISEKAQNLLIFDVGAHKTVATLVEYQLVAQENSKEKVPQVKTVGVGFDRNLGGQDVTRHIREFLVKEFKNKHKTDKDITDNPRAMAKMWKESDRVKQVLSANNDHFAQIEGVFEDKDFKVKVTRELVDQYIESVQDRFMQPVKDALAQAGIDASGLDQVVLMGAGTRIPKVQKLLTDFIQGKELARFLNTDEAIALGSVYEAAARSKGFRVKTFKVEDKPVYPTTEEESSYTGLIASQVTDAKKVLAEFEKNEKLKVEKESALNSLESLVYDVSAKLDDESFNKFVTEEEAKTIKEKADQVRTWLEDEASLDTDVKEFKDKRSELVGQSKKIGFRKKQNEERPKHFAKFEDTYQKATGLMVLFANKTTENETVFTEEDIKKYEEEIEKANTWFVEKKEQQLKLALNEDPVITIKDINEKIKSINNEVNLMKSKVYLHQVKIAQAKREAEEKAKKEKEAAEKAANVTIEATAESANATNMNNTAPPESETTTSAPEESTPVAEGAETEDKEGKVDEKEEL